MLASTRRWSLCEGGAREPFSSRDTPMQSATTPQSPGFFGIQRRSDEDIRNPEGSPATIRDLVDYDESSAGPCLDQAAWLSAPDPDPARLWTGSTNRWRGPMLGKVFKAYDVRATVPKPLTERIAWQIGHGAADLVAALTHTA